MADDADSKSVGRTPVWVQVPPPAVTMYPQILDFTRVCGIFIDLEPGKSTQKKHRQKNLFPSVGAFALLN